MLSVSSQVRIYLARHPVDMRKSFHGLIGLTESVLQRDPLSGHLFVFINRRRDRIKLLYWAVRVSAFLDRVVLRDGNLGLQDTEESARFPWQRVNAQINVGRDWTD